MGEKAAAALFDRLRDFERPGTLAAVWTMLEAVPDAP
jgi:hypothetical protein